jgi:hypothetical protein
MEDLPAWAHLNGVSFNKVKVTSTEGKGYGVVSDTDSSAVDAGSNTPALLTVPHDLVLNTAAVEEYAKEDKNFRQLLDAVGHRVTEFSFPASFNIRIDWDLTAFIV